MSELPPSFSVLKVGDRVQNTELTLEQQSVVRSIKNLIELEFRRSTTENEERAYIGGTRLAEYFLMFHYNAGQPKEEEKGKQEFLDAIVGEDTTARNTLKELLDRQLEQFYKPEPGAYARWH